MTLNDEIADLYRPPHSSRRGAITSVHTAPTAIVRGVRERQERRTDQSKRVPQGSLECRASGHTDIRTRKFYATRHTFISIALTGGVNLKSLADYCGTSVAMIEKNYRRFLPEGAEPPLQLLGSSAVPANTP